MNQEPNSEAAETVQTMEIPAVAVSRLVRLLPCPFCGDDAKMYAETVTCSNPSCKMHFGLVPDMHSVEERNERSNRYLWRQLEDAREERQKARRALAQIREGITNEEENGLWEADTILSIIDSVLGPQAEYRLLSRTDTIQADDEFLTDDCQTWASVGERALRYIIGKPYSTGFFQPMRRRTSLPNT